jgi:hypothetical protein
MPDLCEVVEKLKGHISRHMKQIALYVLGGNNQDDSDAESQASNNAKGAGSSDGGLDDDDDEVSIGVSESSLPGQPSDFQDREHILAAEYHDRPHDALSRVRSQVNSTKRDLMPLHIPPHVHVREPSTVPDTVENSWGFPLNLIPSISLAAEIIFFSNAMRRLLYNEYHVPPRLPSSLSADGLQLHGNISDTKDWLQLYKKELSRGQEDIGDLTSLERTLGEESSKCVEISEALISVLASLERNGYQHLLVDGQPSTSGVHPPGFSVSDLIQALSKLSSEYQSLWEKYHSSPFHLLSKTSPTVLSTFGAKSRNASTCWRLAINNGPDPRQFNEQSTNVKGFWKAA